MKLSKKLLSILLCMLMLVGIMPVGAFADESNNTDASINTTDYDLTGIDGIGKVLAKASAAKDDTENNEYAFSALIINGKKASVGFNNAEPCTIVVAIYSENDGRMLGSGIKEVEPNTFETEIDIDIDSMPRYFIAKAFMLDTEYASLCPAYSVIEYTEEFEKFDKKTVDDFEGDVIINFDEKKDDNFAVLADGSAEIESNSSKNKLASYNESTGKYTFENIDSTVSSLNIGDVFTFETNGEIYLLKIKSIDINGSSAVIYEEPETDYSDYFKYIDVDESSLTDGSDVTVDTSNMEDGIEYLGDSTWDDDLETQSLIDVDDNFSVTPKEWKTDKFLAGSSGSDAKVKVTFKLKASVGFNIRIYYDADWEWKWDFWNSYSDYFYCQVKIDFKLTGSISLTGALSHDFYLGSFDFVTPVGVIVSINVKLHLEVSASVILSIDFIKMTIGFKYDEDSGFQNLCSGPKISIIPKVEGQAEAKVGVILGPGISFVKVVEISLDPEFGAKITLKTDSVSLDQLLNLKSVDYIHSCGLLNCFNGDISLYSSCNLEGRIFNKKKDSEISAGRTWKLTDCHLTISPFEFTLSECSKIAWRCDFKVVNKNGKAINNLDVRSGGPDLGDKYKYNVINATDSTGTVSFFYPKGSYTAKFILNGKEAATKSITVADTTKTITVKIDTDLTEGGGSGHNEGTGSTDWFMCNATFNANGGKFADGTTKKTLEIRSNNSIVPPSEPTRDNYYFDCWYYKDSSGKEVGMPDTMPGKDVTFYARWSTTPVAGYSDGTGSNDGWADSTHIRFGSYPQTDVTASMGKTLDAKATGWKSYKYYEGTGSYGTMHESDYMTYCDVKYGGNKYRGVKFNTYRPYCTGYTSSATYQDDNGYTIGNTYWFRYEPLVWRVLGTEKDGTIVMSENIIDSQAFNNYVLSADGKYWADSGKTYYASNYSKSSLRDWLINDFYSTAFSSTQQSKIMTRECDNSCYSSSYPEYNSNPLKTNDKVFLLSYDEVKNTKYGFNSDQKVADPARGAKGTDYAKCQGLFVYKSSGSVYDGNSCWWLRSPYRSSNDTCGVDYDAYSGSNCNVDSTAVGVRPALKLNLSSLSTQSEVSTQAAKEGTVFNYTCSAGVAGGEYILLNVTGYGSDFELTTSNLEYIDQLTADSNGTVEGTFMPRNAYPNSTTLLIGKFGNTVQAKKLDVTEGTAEEIAEKFEIKGYVEKLPVDYKATLTFTATVKAPAGYKIVWSNGQEGNTCTLSKVTNNEYKVSAKLVKISDGTTLKETKIETVTVKTSFFAKLIAFFKGLFGSLPKYVDNKRV